MLQIFYVCREARESALQAIGRGSAAIGGGEVRLTCLPCTKAQTMQDTGQTPCSGGLAPFRRAPEAEVRKGQLNRVQTMEN